MRKRPAGTGEHQNSDWGLRQKMLGIFNRFHDPGVSEQTAEEFCGAGGAVGGAQQQVEPSHHAWLAGQIAGLRLGELGRRHKSQPATRRQNTLRRF